MFLSLLLGVVIGLPIIISTYDSYQTRHKVQADSKIFTLTGTIDHGWAKGAVPAWKMLVLELMETHATPAIIEVNQGDTIVLKLTSNDVVHGFSLKDFGIFVNEGIEPGKPVVVTFVADRIGEFTFSCNAICGDNHQNMQGTLIVKV